MSDQDRSRELARLRKKRQREHQTVDARKEEAKRQQQAARARETDQRRSARLAHMCERAVSRRQSEDTQRRSARLAQVCERTLSRRQSEDTQQRSARLQTMRETNRSQRSEAQIANSQLLITKEQYLHHNGWNDAVQPLHTQRWAVSAMKSFHKKQRQWQHMLCTVCHEMWPTRVSRQRDPYVCTRCQRDKKDTKLFSAANDMDPGSVPACLRNLSQVEEMLIARACPIMTIYRKHGGQRGYKGHVVNLPQNVQGFLDSLPARVAELPVIVVRRTGTSNSYADFRVRRERVLRALKWLRRYNPCFTDIRIDHCNLQRLPLDGIPEGIRCMDESEECETHEDQEDNGPQETRSFLPAPIPRPTEELAISSALSGDEPVPWPSIGECALNEFQTPFLATKCFPTLFPHGTGDPTNPARLRGVHLAEALRHLNKYGDFSAGSATPTWRFASHPRFPYWGLNMKHRHELLSQTSVYLRQHPGDANLTIDDLRSMVDTMSSQQLLTRLQRYAANVQGSSQFWYQRQQELRSLLEQMGPPTFFWTVSSADNHWPDLHRLLPHASTSPSCTEKRQAVIDCPHLTDWYFTRRVQDFVEHWLYDTLDADWHWYRFEYQARGSTHAHGCARLRNDPGICNLMLDAALAWQVQTALSDDDTPTPEQQLILDAGAKAESTVIRYSDWLVSTCNASMPDSDWMFPDPHPCAQDIEQIDNMDQDYQSLLNTVQRHTHCSSAYCLRRKDGQSQLKCRFDYPRAVQACSTLTFERLSDGSIRGTLTTRRDDPRVNSHNRVLLQNFRANVDLQIIVDVQACARYMAKYAAKGEPRSRDVQALFRSCIQGQSETSDTHQVLRRVMLRSVGERDFAAQETGHMLQSLPLTSCTYKFVTVSLTNSCRVSRDETTSEVIFTQSHLEQYSSRAISLAQVNLRDFFATYTVVAGNKTKARPTPVIVRTYPAYSSNPKGDNYGQYCHFQLLKYHPWSSTTAFPWQQDDSTDEVNVAAYTQFLGTDKGRNSIPTFADELQRAERYLSQSACDTDEDDSWAPSTDQEDWMVLCQLHQDLSNVSSPTTAVDWSEYSRTLPPATLRESAKWIKTTKVTCNLAQCRPAVRDPLDVSTLNTDQSLAYNIVRRHYHHHSTNRESPAPLRMIVCGRAGTGKSYLNTAIVQCLGESAVVTGTTGLAAFHICGATLHSGLQLPCRACNKRELQGAALQRLQTQWKGKHYLIIDEMSMLGQTTFAWVDKRLRQATGKHDQLLGGISVILFGDFAQLPPVGDKPLFASVSNQQLSFHGYTVYQQFTTVVILQQLQRQTGTTEDDDTFRELLGRLRNGEVTKTDWQTLLTRSPTKAANYGEFSDAQHLYYDKKSVGEYNHTKLTELGAPIAVLHAIHSGANATLAKPDDASGLYPTVLLAKGARVMLTSNVWQQAGLCNGAPGAVYNFIYPDGHAPPALPTAVLVDFPQYTGPAFLPDRPKCVPIAPITFEWDSKSRQQVPLQLRYAITIHKSQGQTLGKTVIDIGKSELSSGCTYVALSRLRALTDVILQPMSFERLESIGRAKRMTERRTEESRLERLFAQTMQQET